MRKKLIEVALPLDAINREAAREKSIRHGHPSTLHLWWARRPLAACRAVLFAQLVDDPSARPDEFPTEEAQDEERQRLFGIIERLVKWENSNNEDVLAEAKAEIWKSCDGNPPPILDPFAGGGSIPLEAQRLGLEAHASDLNPVAVLINKALIEIPPKFAGQPPVNPEGREKLTTWKGAQGLADDVRYYGKWLRDEAERRIGHLYPKATLPDGSKATVIAWIWARTVTCPNPACGATMPLVRSFWLGKKKGKEAWVDPKVENGRVRFEIGSGPVGPPVAGTVTRTGATCVVCSSPTPLSFIRSEGKASRIGCRLMAVVAEGHRRRIYLEPTDEHEKAALLRSPDSAFDTELPSQALGFRVQSYGMTHHADLFTSRQLHTLTTLSELVAHVGGRASADGADDATVGSIATYLAFVISRVANRGSALCLWDNSPGMEASTQTFVRQAVSMVWDFAETNPFGGSSGNIEDAIDWTTRVLERLPATARPGIVTKADASLGPDRVPVVVATDPPYYDNIGYADLSDFFYVWLRRSLRPYFPELFATVLTPKSAELVADPFRHGGEHEAEKFFEDGFVRTFRVMRDAHAVGIPLTLFYAFKQSETDGDGEASTGWETMLAGLIEAGLAITGTWPMRTELGNRMRNVASNALASSIVLVCRPRSVDAGVTDRAGFLRALKTELPRSLRDLQKSSIAPVDLAQAAIGPGMAVFSRYVRVVEPSGDAMRVRTALSLINQVLDSVLDEQEGDFDPETRWCTKWFEQRGMDEGPYGEAEVLSTAMGTSVTKMVDGGILLAKAGKVFLRPREDYPDEWNPATDTKSSIWEATQHLVKALDEGGEAGAADLLRRLGGVGDSSHLLAYRLYSICERRKWSREGGAYNALAASWPEIQRIAASPAPVGPGTLWGEG